MKIIGIVLFILFGFGAIAQSYTSYITGDEGDVEVQPVPGIVLMGGAGEQDDAMKWFLERVNGGDVLVIRASGSDGYNDYLFSDLGVQVNSVETIVWNSAEASEDPYVLQQLANAEGIWMAGGDQWDYVSYWRDNEVEDLINNLLNVIGGPVGGISAGMAVLGGNYFTAQYGTVYSDESLANPYNNWLHYGHNDFLAANYLENVITDTHYDDPDRRGRHVTFMARMHTDFGTHPLGIACDEYAAVCIDADGIAWCFGEFPDYDDYIYFLRPNCEEPIGPEDCSLGNPLEWNRNHAAIKCCRFGGTVEGDNYFDLKDWLTSNGGEWQTWYVENGSLEIIEDGQEPDCALGILNREFEVLNVYPSPASDQFRIDSPTSDVLQIVDASGRLTREITLAPGTTTISCSDWSSGYYLLSLKKSGASGKITVKD